MRSRLALVLVAALAVSACGDVLDELTATTTSQPAGATTAATLAQPAGGETATIVRVLDGDSLEAEVDGNDVEVRLLGINTPEGWECHGDAAKEAFVGLLADTEVTLVADPAVDQDQFDRLLRYVYLDGTNLNAEMVRRGHA
ncbi:MAG: thermonuclease family protein, partial [Acidimicrobiia bacterium]|nr:thermonuclease family protein [Acidimicrobiia bacterium]